MFAKIELLFMNISIEDITYELLTRSIITDDFIMTKNNIIYPFSWRFNIYNLNETY